MPQLAPEVANDYRPQQLGHRLTLTDRKLKQNEVPVLVLKRNIDLEALATRPGHSLILSGLDSRI